MKWNTIILSLLACTMFFQSGLTLAKQQKTLLIGGGLEVCTSLHPQFCASSSALKQSDAFSHTYQLTTKAITKIQSAVQQDKTLQSERFLRFVDNIRINKIKTEPVPAKQLSRLLRQKKVGDAFELSNYQWQLILDITQQSIVAKSFLQRDKIKDVEVELLASKKPFVSKILRELVTTNNSSDVLLVTAANSDAFADVYWLLEAFEQLDVTVRWLPLDAAVAEVWRQHGTKNSKALKLACQLLPDVRAKQLKRFDRERVYPELHAQLKETCEEPEEAIDLIDESDLVYFHEGQASNLVQSLMRDDITPNFIWSELLKKQKQNKIAMAFNGDSVAAVTGTSGKNAFVERGDSYDTLLSGLALLSAVKSAGDFYLTSVPTFGISGLNLLSGFTFDSHFSNMSRQGRLMSLLATVQVPYGLGIDERTMLVVENNTDGFQFSVSGEGGVSWFENTETQVSSLTPLKLSRLNVHYLTDGDRVSLKDDKLLFDFANWKYSSNRYSQPIVQAGSVFRGEDFSKTMYMLCSTGAKEAWLKHTELGVGHQFKVTKRPGAISVSGSQNVNGSQYRYCSYRDYQISASPL